MALVQEGQAARHIQRDGLAETQLPLPAISPAPEHVAHSHLGMGIMVHGRMQLLSWLKLREAGTEVTRYHHN